MSYKVHKIFYTFFSYIISFIWGETEAITWRLFFKSSYDWKFSEKPEMKGRIHQRKNCLHFLIKINVLIIYVSVHFGFLNLRQHKNLRFCLFPIHNSTEYWIIMKRYFLWFILWRNKNVIMDLSINISNGVRVY